MAGRRKTSFVSWKIMSMTPQDLHPKSWMDLQENHPNGTTSTRKPQSPLAKSLETREEKEEARALAEMTMAAEALVVLLGRADHLVGTISLPGLLEVMMQGRGVNLGQMREDPEDRARPHWLAHLLAHNPLPQPPHTPLHRPHLSCRQ